MNTLPFLMAVAGSFLYIVFGQPRPAPTGSTLWWRPFIAELGRLCAFAGFLALAIHNSWTPLQNLIGH